MNQNRVGLAAKAADIVDQAYRLGWIDGIRRMEGVFPNTEDKLTPMSLLQRFVELYAEVPLTGSMIVDGVKLCAITTSSPENT